jgi:hypothetical protein
MNHIAAPISKSQRFQRLVSVMLSVFESFGQISQRPDELID